MGNIECYDIRINITMRVIINADDCGKNEQVNCHIKKAIEAGKLTSTTIMANMSDVEGALQLYEEYFKQISFGIHLNLTEGEPLLKSKKLLEFGYYSEHDGEMVFDGEKAEYFRYKILPRDIRDEIYKELSAQVNLLQKGGAILSHIDSHHHIHTCFSLIDVIAQLSKDFNLYKIRRIRNYVPRSFSFYGRQAWATFSYIKNRQYVMTDFFAIFKEFFEKERISQLKPDSSIELMIHPGHYMESYQKEEQMMLEIDYPSDLILTNYNSL